MVLKIKHKAGKFNNRWYVDFYLIALFYWYKLLGVTHVRVWFKFTKKSFYVIPGNDQQDWLKTFGARSGTKTQKNTERIAAYRFNGEKFQICDYRRKNKKHLEVINIVRQKN